MRVERLDGRQTPQTGGLTTVSTDTTLTGDGTAGDPLKVAHPYVPGDATFGLEYNKIKLPGTWTYVTGSLANVDQDGEVGYQLGSPARYKVVADNLITRALLRQWAKTGAKFQVGQHVLTLTLDYAESPSGTFVLTG